MRNSSGEDARGSSNSDIILTVITAPANSADQNYDGENAVDLVSEKFQQASIDQYKIEERSIVAKRLLSYSDRIKGLLDCMMNDTLSTKENIELLKSKIYDYTLDLKFKHSKNMGEILKNALDYVKRNYETVNTKTL